MTFSLYAMSASYSLHSDDLMADPFHFGEVNTVFEHVPQGGHLAQTTDRILDQLHGIIDLFVSGEATDGKTNRAVGQFIAQPQSSQHIGGLQTGRGTGRAGGDR